MLKNASSEKGRKRIFIIDDHPVCREGLVEMVNENPDLVVCGMAGDAAAGLSAIEKERPEMVITDLTLPGRSGLELIKDIHALRPDLAILVISMHDETLYAERVLRAGGRGYIMKDEDNEKILKAIRHVLGGQIYLSRKMSARLLDAFSSRTVANASPISVLTDREFEILQLIGHGKDTHAIASQLNLSVKTVDTHRGHLKEKLHLKNGTELICYAARWVETQAPTAPAAAAAAG